MGDAEIGGDEKEGVGAFEAVVGVAEEEEPGGEGKGGERLILPTVFCEGVWGVCVGRQAKRVEEMFSSLVWFCADEKLVSSK